MKKNELFCFLIDDDQEDREFFTLAMKKLDDEIRLEAANDAESALQRLRATKDLVPDYIFLDLKLGPMDGKTCLVELKKLPHLVDTPVIIYSTNINEKIIYDTLKMGAFDHIEKPASLDTLVNYLKRVMQIAQ